MEPSYRAKPCWVCPWAHLGMALVIALLLTPAWADRRVALVIGNAQYQQEAALRNPLNDAQLLARTLKARPLQFDEVLTLSNGNRAQMLQQLARFAKLAQGADAALLYYSGHGMINSKRQNHVLPVDMPKLSANADLDIDAALKAYGVSETELIDAVEGAKVQVVVLDACRDNGFGTQKSGSKGLARRTDQSKNRLIAYATEEGFTAEDGKGQNSTYAQSLAKHLVRTDLPLLTVFDEVANDVEKQTANKQSPTRSGNLRTNVYLVAGVAAVPTPLPSPALAQPAPSVQALETIDGRYQIWAGGAEVKDLKTGLIWQRCSVGQIWIGSACMGELKKYDFDSAQKLALDGWRVPTMDELAGLVDKSAGSPTIHQKGFPNTPAIFFWSSSPCGDSGACGAHFVNGILGSYNRHSAAAVRLIRTKQ